MLHDSKIDISIKLRNHLSLAQCPEKLCIRKIFDKNPWVGIILVGMNECGEFGGGCCEGNTPTM